MTDSVFSSPARSWRDVKSTNSLSDSEGESYPWECMSSETRVTADITIISGWLKFRDQKKWKLRWGVVTKLSPAADCLHLQLYRDSRDRYKQGLTKASLSLQHFLGLETGFTLDKESNTVAIVCQDLIVVLAFDTRERLIQWQVKIYTHLGEDEQYLIQISSSPPKAKLSAGPAKLHIQEHRFCLTIGVPPKLVGSWEIKHLRRFGVVDGKFCFEGGSLCGRGEGLYVFLTDQAEEITHHVQLAAEGKLLKTCKRPSLSNPTAGQCQSPRRSLTLKNATHRITSQMINDDNETDVLRNGSSIMDEHDVRRWPSVETQADLYGHADTSSLTDFAIDSQNAKVCNWGLENQLMGRCVSCVGKLGLISRCSTAANTPGSINFNPWSNHDSKLCLDGVTREEDLLDELHCSCGVSCGAPSVSHKSKYSDRSSSGGRTDYSEEHSCCSHSSTENISKKPSSVLAPSSPPAKNFSSSSDVAFSNGAPPSRPPKPQKYRTSSTEKKITKAPMPLPNENADEADVKSRTTCIHGSNEVALGDPLLYKKNMCSDASQFYDTPRNMKKVVNESFANYDVPPPAIHHVYDDCLCVAKARLSLRPDDRNCSEDCFCGKISRYPPVWFQLPLHHFQCKNHWPNVERMSEKMAPTDANDGPVYAQVDLSKKLKNRLICTKESEAALKNRQPRNSENCANDSAGRCYTNLRFGHNNNNNNGGVVDESAVNYDRLANLNYMNLEFSNSLRYYENVRELMKNRDSSRIDSLNIDLPANSSLSGGVGGGGGRCRENQCCKCALKSDVASNGTSLETQFENYVPMSPLKTATKRLAIRNGGGGGICGRNIAVETLSLDRRASRTAPTQTPTTAAAAATTTTMMMTMMMMITTTTASSTTYAAATTTAAAMASDTASTSTRASSAAIVMATASSSTPKATSALRHVCESDATLDARKRSNSIECGTQLAARCEPQPPKGSLGDSDSGLESDKLSQENDDTVENLKRRKGTQLLGLRRFASSNGYKATNANANRDSSSSNDSGFSAASLKYACNEFSDFEMPLTTATSSAKRHHSFNQRCRKNDCTLPRRSKSSDPLRDLTFHFHKDVGGSSAAKSSSAEAELPLCLNKRDRCKDCPSPADTTASTPYVDCRSTSSGTSDMSDYIETLSLSSHSSADVHSSEAVKLHQSAVTTLKPRSGVEYQKIDRSSLLASQSKF